MYQWKDLVKNSDILIVITLWLSLFRIFKYSIPKFMMKIVHLLINVIWCDICFPGLCVHKLNGQFSYFKENTNEYFEFLLPFNSKLYINAGVLNLWPADVLCVT
jgi:hypothetical protein